MVFHGFWECFGKPGPLKMSVSARRGAIFEKFTFFRPDAFWIDFRLILAGFGSHVGTQNGVKMG